MLLSELRESITVENQVLVSDNFASIFTETEFVHHPNPSPTFAGLL
jgi:hypothetical protein